MAEEKTTLTDEQIVTTYGTGVLPGLKTHGTKKYELSIDVDGGDADDNGDADGTDNGDADGTDTGDQADSGADTGDSDSDGRDS